MYFAKISDFFKKVFVFLVKIKSLSEINTRTEILDKSRLQASEVDWSAFMTKKEAEDKIFFRFKPLLNLI